jgi:hypothetical protein
VDLSTKSLEDWCALSWRCYTLGHCFTSYEAAFTARRMLMEWLTALDKVTGNLCGSKTCMNFFECDNVIVNGDEDSDGNSDGRNSAMRSLVPEFMCVNVEEVYHCALTLIRLARRREANRLISSFLAAPSQEMGAPVCGKRNKKKAARALSKQNQLIRKLERLSKEA